MPNFFFKNNGPFIVSDIIGFLGIDTELDKKLTVKDIKDLSSADINEITFYHSKKYKFIANNTKASFCITSNALKDDLPKSCKTLIVKDVLLSSSILTSKFYPSSINDDFDYLIHKIENIHLINKVEHGFNVLIGENVSIGLNCKIGHNTIIEKNVVIGDNCSIGSNVIIRNSIIKNSVRILDHCVIGKHGFGFFPNNKKNLRYPHIGIVMIENNCEIGSGTIIDRGSMSDTFIGSNTFIDNQVHIAHNVKIGTNTIIAGQVGIAGSTKIGNNVKIGGKAGISGHLIIGDNVEIGGGSGVIKDIPDNHKVMGYPAKKIRDFLKENR